MATSRTDPTADANAADEPESPDAGSTSRAAPPGPENPLAAVERERDEFRANALRATADYQNLRRRLQSDIDAAVARAVKPLHQELLLVLDYLDMALATPCTTPEGRSLLAGVQMTRTQLAQLLERADVRAIPEGGQFDPALHQAVERVETSEHAPGTILSTLRTGFTLKGQILRPAQVRVAVSADAEASPPEGAGS